jgi:GDP-mannose 6-dehydrogenase
MNITVMGLGYVGSVTSACLSINHRVTGVDVAKNKVDLINSGRSPIIEPEIEALVWDAHEAGSLRASYDSDYTLDNADVVIVCVGTPSNSSGEVDLTALVNVTKFLSALLKDADKKPAIIYRSTVPPGTMENIILALYDKYLPSIDFPVIYHPEFLREGSAVRDFQENPQVVVAPVAGADNSGVETLFREIYQGIKYRLYCVDVKTAEMIKYLNNTYHALKVAFVNEILRVCSVKGININHLFRIFMEDGKLNISKAYLSPGFAYGGSCLPKDVRGITALARHLNIDIPLVMNIDKSNELHIDFAFQKILDTGVSKIGLYGLSFKPGTDDVRESAFVKLIERLLGKGKEIKVYDESLSLGNMMGQNLEYLVTHIPHISQRLVNDLGDLVSFADLIILCHYDERILDIVRGNPSKTLMDLTGKVDGKYLCQNVRSIMTSSQ